MSGVVLSSGRNLTEGITTRDLELPWVPSVVFNAVVIATQNLSHCNKLGEGGFGSVYKVKIVKHSENRVNVIPGIGFIYLVKYVVSGKVSWSET